MSRDLVIFGSKFPDVRHLIDSINKTKIHYRVVGIVDENPELHALTILGWRVLGGMEWLGKHKDDVQVVCTVGSEMGLRERVNNRLTNLGCNFATLIDPSVDVEGSEIGNHVMVFKNSIIGPNAKIGANSIISFNSIVGHDTKIGENCFISGGAVLPGWVDVGNRTLVGTNATCRPRINIGSDVIIGSGAVLLSDVKSNHTAIGNPAKMMRRQAI